MAFHRGPGITPVRLAVRIAVLGLWTGLIGGTVVYLASVTATAFDSADASAESIPGIIFASSVSGGVVLLYRSGLVTLGIGAGLMTLGALLVVRITR